MAAELEKSDLHAAAPEKFTDPYLQRILTDVEELLRKLLQGGWTYRTPANSLEAEAENPPNPR